MIHKFWIGFHTCIFIGLCFLASPLVAVLNAGTVAILLTTHEYFINKKKN